MSTKNEIKAKIVEIKTKIHDFGAIELETDKKIKELTFNEIKEIYKKVDLDFDKELNMEQGRGMLHAAGTTLVQTPKGKKYIFHYDEGEENIYEYLRDFYESDEATTYRCPEEDCYKSKDKDLYIEEEVNWFCNATINEGFTLMKIGKFIEVEDLKIGKETSVDCNLTIWEVYGKNGLYHIKQHKQKNGTYTFTIDKEHGDNNWIKLHEDNTFYKCYLKILEIEEERYGK